MGMNETDESITQDRRTPMGKPPCTYVSLLPFVIVSSESDILNPGITENPHLGNINPSPCPSPEV